MYTYHIWYIPKGQSLGYIQIETRSSLQHNMKSLKCRFGKSKIMEVAWHA